MSTHSGSHKQTISIQSYLSKTQRPTIYNAITVKTIMWGRKLRENIHECQLAVRRHDKNSLVSQQTSSTHFLNWETVNILD